MLHDWIFFCFAIIVLHIGFSPIFSLGRLSTNQLENRNKQLCEARGRGMIENVETSLKTGRGLTTFMSLEDMGKSEKSRATDILVVDRM